MPAAASFCVYCHRRQIHPEWRPFCSERCKMADLGRWLLEEYRVPGETAPVDPDGDASRPDDG
jgi:endogenous inhibitor of DNA gyrase (YacG/DUF329 family)